MDTKKLRQKILDLAIHGKLVPQDPNDEPASVLLERIKAEKERLIKEGKIKRSKKSAKTSDTPHYENVPFEVPEGWVWCRLGDVISIKSGDSIRVRDNRQGEYPIYGGNGINGYYSDCNVEPDTIVIGRVGFYCGSVHQTISKAWVTDNAFIVSCESVFNSKYLCHLLEWLQLSKTSNSTAQPVISGKGIYPLLIPLPPLYEQERIVSEVKRCFTLIAQIEQGKSDLQTIIKQAKSKILDLAIHGKLVPQDPNDEPAIELLKRINPDFTPCDNGHYTQLPFEAPQNWSWTTLGKIGKWQSGSTPNRLNKDYYNGNIPWLKTGDLNNGYITHIPESITEKALNETSVKLNPTGSVLIAMYGATTGKIGILTFPATTNQACCACEVFNGIDKEFLFLFLLSHREEFIKMGGGGAQPNISKEKIINTYIPLPPFAEQKKNCKYG